MRLASRLPALCHSATPLEMSKDFDRAWTSARDRIASWPGPGPAGQEDGLAQVLRAIEVGSCLRGLPAIGGGSAGDGRLAVGGLDSDSSHTFVSAKNSIFLVLSHLATAV
jgi:hypothetical protein